MNQEKYEKLRREILGDLADNPSKVTEKAPICTCGVVMIRRFGKGDYYCQFCLIFHKQLQDDKTRKSHQKSQDEQHAIIAKNDLHPLYGFIRHLTVKMLEEHGLKHNVILRNIKGANHKILGNGTHQIKFGYHAVDYLAENGFQEHTKGYRYLWASQEELKGKKACWALAIHEAAHALQGERNGRYRGSQHNQVWAQAVEELQILYPWEEVKDL